MPQNKFDELRARAESNDPQSMLELALAYRDGEGVEPDPDEFFVWVRKAAVIRDPDAIYELALAYKEGVGTEPDVSKYIEWLQEAANSGQVSALYDLAIAYKDGDGVPPDDKKFFTLIKKAADGDEPDAMVELAFAYKEGIGTIRRASSYFTWLRKAADFDQKDAMLHLAFAYRNREGVSRADNKQFFYWLERAAKAGQQDSMFHLAIAYRYGEGVKRNNKRFFEWMAKAARAGVAAAMYHLALAYLSGTGTRYDFQQFSFWARRALAAGYSKGFIVSGLADLQRQRVITNKALLELHDDLNELYQAVMKIKREHVVKPDEARDGVAHFTTIEALESMLPGSRSSDRLTNCLRLYNFAYMNDPTEGKRLLDRGIPQSALLREFFPEEGDSDNPLSWEDHESSVYIGSFTLKGDELDLWRAYGRDGTGYCIVTPLEAFDQESMNEVGPLHGGEVVKVSGEARTSAEYLPTTLYAIRYEEDDVTRTLAALKGSLNKLKHKKQSLGDAGEVLDRIVRLIVSQILYLYKNEQYKSEKEARLIGDFDISTDFLNQDARKPARVFVDSQDFLFKHEGSLIIIGPKVLDQTIVEIDLKYRLSRHGFLETIKVTRTKVQYR
jgi:TPR repeat protein